MRLSLSEVPSTGYIWVSANLEPTVTLADQRFVEVEAGIFGGGGVREFRFSMAQAGTLNLVLAMQRPWLGEKSETSSFRIRLIVEDERLGINPKMLLVET
jgi:predicted secreted protein